VTLPAGYTTQGLPIGMQTIGRAWEESLLLRIAVNAEEVVERKQPKVHYRIL
jgi:amidase